MRRPIFVKHKFYVECIMLQGRPTGGREVLTGDPTELPFPLTERFSFAGKMLLSRPRRILARRREVLTGAASLRRIVLRGMGADSRRPRPLRDPVGRLRMSSWPSRRLPLAPLLSALIRATLGPLQDGVPRLVGRCHLSGGLVGPRRGTQSAPYRRFCFTSESASCSFLRATKSLFPAARLLFFSGVLGRPPGNSQRFVNLAGHP